MSTSKKRKRLTSNVISCDKCSVTFSVAKNLYRHMKTFHPEEKIEMNNSQICTLCEEKLHTLKQLQDHILNCHKDIVLSFEKNTFYSEFDFASWKESVEKNSVSYFRMYSSRKDENGTVTKYYMCHRSGSVKSKVEERKRAQRESVKCGYACPAAMKAVFETYNETQLIEVEYQSVHIGHDLVESKIRLSKNERGRLASMLSSGVTHTEVLEKLQRDNFATKKLTLKDLHNVQRDFLVNKNFLAEDSKSVEKLVQKIKDANAVLIHKPIGERSSVHPAVGKDDFLLGIMNEEQQKLFVLYGEHYVMVDSTLGINGYKYQLTTLFVHDLNKQKFPIAVLFSSVITPQIVDAFFAEIKRKCPSFSSKFLISMDTDIFYDSWRKIFGVESQHILFNWQLKHLLGIHLISKVKDKDVRNNMREDLYAILKESQILTFENLWSKFFQDHDREELFLSYLKVHYGERKKKWAYCYTKDCGIVTTKKFERWHKNFKRGETEESNFLVKLDPTLSIVLQKTTRIILERITAVERGWTPRMELIRNTHSLCTSSVGSVSNVKEVQPNEKWVITEKCGQSYEVTTNVVTCDCDIICSDCDVCLKQKTCTCVDYNVRYVICKHIHQVCTFFSAQIVGLLRSSGVDTVQNVCDVQFVMDVEDHNDVGRRDQDGVIVVEVQIEDTDQRDCEEEKQSLLTALNALKNRLRMLECKEQLRFFKDQIDVLNSYFEDAPSPNLSQIPVTNVNNRP